MFGVFGGVVIFRFLFYDSGFVCQNTWYSHPFL